jgi:L-ascorbate metabolism protein UlaG (beta-lactamase superfamily)
MIRILPLFLFILFLSACSNKQTFQNPEGSLSMEGKVSSWTSFFAKRALDSRKNYMDHLQEHHLDQEAALVNFHEHKDSESVTWIGHATFLITLCETTILTDPFFTDIAGPLGIGPKRFTPPPVAIDHIDKLDVIVCSHNHYDHLDMKSLRLLKRKFGSGVQIVCPLGLSKYFLRCGFTKIQELNWYENTKVNDIEIVCLPSVHNSGRSPFDQNKTLWCGFGFKSTDLTLYFSGDTAYHPTLFKEVGETLGTCHLAMLGIGAYEPQDLLQKSHAAPHEAVEIAIDLGARNIMGMHWGLLSLSNEPVDEPIKKFLEAATSKGFESDAIWLLKSGETRPLMKDVK